MISVAANNFPAGRQWLFLCSLSSPCHSWSLSICPLSYSLSEKSQEDAACLPYAAWDGHTGCLGCKQLEVYEALSLMDMYICVCWCAHFPLPPHWLLPFTLLFWARLGREFEVTTDFVSFSFTKGCFSQELKNTLNQWKKKRQKKKPCSESEQGTKTWFPPNIWEHWIENENI